MILKLTRFHKEKQNVNVSSGGCKGIFKLLLASHSVEFETVSEAHQLIIS